ncbi:MAG: ligase-associated DNA damage response endonuclease PdeM [Pirellulales bacterium]
MKPPSISAADAGSAATGDGIVLLPGRAAWLPATGTLLAADLHLGKAASFRRAGIPVPEGTAAADLDRLTRLLAERRARRLVVLGDLFHALGGMTAAVEGQFRDWRAGLTDVEVVLVVGNHDARLRHRLTALGLDAIVDRLVEPPFVFVHDPCGETVPEGGWVVGGHLHPRVTLRGPSGDRITERCFIAAAGRLVLPACGSFTGGGPLPPPADARVWMAGDDAVVEVTRLLELAARGQRS